MNSLYDHSHELPEPLRTLARDMDTKEPANEDERQAQHCGRAYIDHEGHWHTGQHYTEQSDVPASMRMNGRWPAWLREGLAWLVPISLLGMFGLWLDRVWFAFHVFILRMVSLFS